MEIDKTFKGVFLTDTPQASNFKADIIGWMCWWPLSIIGTLLNDPVKRLFHWTFETLSGSYQKIADKIVPKVD